jgi:hypothetical protein
MRVEDGRGMFHRNAGQNALKTSVNGGEIGSVDSFDMTGAPDYTNMETVNRIPSVNNTWTVDRDGYVLVEARGTMDSAPAFVINNIRILRALTHPGEIKHICHVCKNQTLKLETQTPGYPLDICNCFYIPPVKNKGSISVNVYMSY